MSTSRRDISEAKVGDRVHITLAASTQYYCTRGTITRVIAPTETQSAAFEVMEDDRTTEPYGTYGPGTLTLYTEQELQQEQANTYMRKPHVLERHSDAHGQVNFAALAADASQHLRFFDAGEYDSEGIPDWLLYMANDLAAEASLKATIATLRRKMKDIDAQLDQVADRLPLYTAEEARHIATLIRRDTRQIKKLNLANFD